MADCAECHPHAQAVQPARSQPSPAVSLPSCSLDRISSVMTFGGWFLALLQMQLWPELWENNNCLDGNAEAWGHGWCYPISVSRLHVTPTPHCNHVGPLLYGMRNPLCKGKAKTQWQLAICAALPTQGLVLHPAKSPKELLVIGSGSYWMVRTSV